MEREKQALYVTIHEKEKKNSELLKEQKKYEKNESMSVDKLTELQRVVEDMQNNLNAMEDERRELEEERALMEEELARFVQQEQHLEEACATIKEQIAQCDKLREVTVLGINQLENEISEEKRLANDDRAVLEVKKFSLLPLYF